MLPFRTWQRPRRVLFIAAFVVGLAAVFIPTASARGDDSVSVLRVQPLPGKPLISGRVNVVAVHNPFGFVVVLRNGSKARRNISVKVLVRYDRQGEAPLVMRAVGKINGGPGIVRITSAKQVLFAQRARLTVSATDRVAHTTATQHYVVIFALG